MKTRFRLKRNLRHLIGFWLLLLTFPAFGQTIKISGKVLDNNNKQPVIGATVHLKGSSTGALTDIKGEFIFTAKQSLPATLLITYVGYETQEIDVYEELPIDILLKENLNRLSEVVVVGYGTQKREELTGAITSIPVAQLKALSQTSIANGLQGLATGIQVTQSSGAPGSSFTVRIRGGNSITGGNEPLYVIDGFPVYNDNNQISGFNSNDIESIDVLKDASATAIYGSRGANGVIIITTKKGQTGSSQVTYDGSIGFQEVSHKIDLLNAKEWGIYKNDARINNGKPAIYSAAQLDSLGQHGTDWQSAALRRAPIQSHQFSVNGGSEKTKYSVSLGTLSQDGIIINSDFKRYNGRIRLDSKVNDRLNVGLNANGSYIDANNASSITNLLYIPPTVPIYDAKGNYTFVSPYESSVANPIASMKLSTNQSKTSEILASTFADYQIIKGLRAKILFGIDLRNYKNNTYTPSTLFEASSVGGTASITANFTKNILNENTLSYTTSIGKHNLVLLGGFTQQQSETEGIGAGAKTFTNNIVEYNNLGSGSTLVKSSSSYIKWALNSYLGRATYNYDQKYFLTASLRADGSSRLGANNRWGYFPSASVAWQVSKEAFINDFKNAAKISNLKLRLSAGKTGNQEIDPYQSEALLTVYAYPAGSGATTITGYAPSQVANPDLKWETTAQYDGGVDVGFFNDRVKFVFDAYYKKTSDLLLAVPLPLTSGFSTSLQNVGSVENKGIEIALNTQNLQGKFNWTTDISYSLNRNKVLSLSDGVSTILVSGEFQTGSAIIVGQPLGAFWGYKTKGLYRDASEIPTTPLLANTKVGDVKYLDINNDGKVTQAGDMTNIGNSQPKFIFGFTNNFSYANFDLSVFVQGSYGNKVYSYIFQQLMVPTGYQNVYGGFSDHYTSLNTSAKYQRPNELITANPVSDLYVYDATFVRVKSITLGYNLPSKLVSKLKISKIRLYATGQNLFTFTRYPGYDPEVNSYGSTSNRQGLDTGSYPTAKSIIGGVSITF